MHRACLIAVISLCLATILISLPCVIQAQTDQEYTREQIRNTPAETFLALIDKPEQGYERFAAMRALGQKAKLSDADAKASIMSMVVAAMKDNSRTINQRFQCCYAISECGDEQWVPALVDVLNNDPTETMRSVAAEALGSFKTCTTAINALQQAAGTEKNQNVLDVINKNLGSAQYTEEQIKNTSVETFLGYIEKPQPGYEKFAAMRALGQKAKEANTKERESILNIVVKTIYDTTRTENLRFQCCYVISECRDATWVPVLVSVLNNDSSATLRSVAAEALGMFPKSRTARLALTRALRQETSQKVIDVIKRVLSSKAFTAQ